MIGCAKIRIMEIDGLRAYLLLEQATHRPINEERWFLGTNVYPQTHQDISASRLCFLAAFQNAVGPVIDEYLGQAALEHVLEVGCGTGFFSRFLAPDWLRSRMVSMDIRRDGLKELKRNRPDEALLQASSYSMPFRTGSLDAVIGYSSFDSYLYLGNVLRETDRILRPGGRVILFQDLATDTYLMNKETATVEDRLKTPENYHVILVEEARQGGFEVLDGEGHFIDVLAVEPISDIRKRVPDFETYKRELPMMGIWINGAGFMPPFRRETRTALGLSRERVIEMMETLERFSAQSYVEANARNNGFIERVQMRYLVLEKTR